MELPRHCCTSAYSQPWGRYSEQIVCQSQRQRMNYQNRQVSYTRQKNCVINADKCVFEAETCVTKQHKQCWGFESMTALSTTPNVFTSGCLRSIRLHLSGLMSLFSSTHTQYLYIAICIQFAERLIKFEPINKNLRTIIRLIDFFYRSFNYINMTISLKLIEHCNVIYCIFSNRVELNK